MFTGIIECLGTIIQVQQKNKSHILRIRPDISEFPVMVGGSVAVDGICLTLESKNGNEMTFSAVAETLGCTTLCNVKTGKRVNLERALLANGRFDGHVVYGHIDGTGTILNDTTVGNSIIRSFSLPKEAARFITKKGSVAVDGISLTVAQCREDIFEVSLIPQTVAVTNMSLKKPGDEVNIECDMVARYIGRILAGSSDVTRDYTAVDSLSELMKRSGF